MSELLNTVGARVRALREGSGLSRRRLAETSGLSERFLAQLERGEGNISLLRFAQVASALRTTPSALLAAAESGTDAIGDERMAIALLGVRGAGKSTIGRGLAEALDREFIELDQRIEVAAGLSLGEIFELHGEAYYRRLEREVLGQVLAAGGAPVIAAGGSIVNHAENWALLATRTTSIWLKASAEDHWERVIRQGDRRPMAENPHAFSELRALLAARADLYARANHIVETSGIGVSAVLGEVVAALNAE